MPIDFLIQISVKTDRNLTFDILNMSVRTQGTRPGMSRSVIIRFRVNQKSRGKSFMSNSIVDFRTMLFGVFMIWY